MNPFALVFIFFTVLAVSSIAFGAVTALPEVNRLIGLAHKQIATLDPSDPKDARAILALNQSIESLEAKKAWWPALWAFYIKDSHDRRKQARQEIESKVDKATTTQYKSDLDQSWHAHMGESIPDSKDPDKPKAPGSSKIYHTEHGDTALRIANRHNMRVIDIVNANLDVNFSIPLKIGTAIILPETSSRAEKKDAIAPRVQMRPVVIKNNQSKSQNAVTYHTARGDDQKKKAMYQSFEAAIRAEMNRPKSFNSARDLTVEEWVEQTKRRENEAGDIDFDNPTSIRRYGYDKILSFLPEDKKDRREALTKVAHALSGEVQGRRLAYVIGIAKEMDKKQIEIMTKNWLPIKSTAMIKELQALVDHGTISPSDARAALMNLPEKLKTPSVRKYIKSL